MIDLGAAHGVLQKAGAWFSYGTQQLGQGREKTKSYLLEQPALLEEIEKKVRAVMLAGPAPKAGAPPADEDVAPPAL